MLFTKHFHPQLIPEDAEERIPKEPIMVIRIWSLVIAASGVIMSSCSVMEATSASKSMDALIPGRMMYSSTAPFITGGCPLELSPNVNFLTVQHCSGFSPYRNFSKSFSSSVFHMLFIYMEIRYISRTSSFYNGLSSYPNTMFNSECCFKLFM